MAGRQIAFEGTRPEQLRVRLGREALRRASWQPRTCHHGTRVIRDGSAGGRGHTESIPVLIARWGAAAKSHPIACASAGNPWRHSGNLQPWLRLRAPTPSRPPFPASIVNNHRNRRHRPGRLTFQAKPRARPELFSSRRIGIPALLLITQALERAAVDIPTL